jgi:hypothetical protein
MSTLMFWGSARSSLFCVALGGHVGVALGGHDG